MTAAPRALRSALTAALSTQGSTLTPDETHVTERETEIIDGETCYRLSDALENHFLPHRKEILEEYLSSTLLLKLLPLRPIGGFCVH